MVVPVVIGKGKTMFEGIKEKLNLKLMKVNIKVVKQTLTPLVKEKLRTMVKFLVVLFLSQKLIDLDLIDSCLPFYI